MLRGLYKLVRAVYLIVVIPLFLLVTASFAIGGYSTFGDFLLISLLTSPIGYWAIKGYCSVKTA